MKAQKLNIDLGPLNLTLELGDKNGNGVVDVAFGVTVDQLPWLRLPPFIVDLDASLAQKAVDAFKSLGDALTKKK